MLSICTIKHKIIDNLTVQKFPFITCMHTYYDRVYKFLECAIANSSNLHHQVHHKKTAKHATSSSPMKISCCSK